jgi:predicted anti-sigma-YlaC factor YlaD
MEEHPTSEDLAVFLDGPRAPHPLTREESHALCEHLATCDDCFDLFVNVLAEQRSEEPRASMGARF